jgi:hypothetical protein
VGLVGVQSNQFPRAMDLARRFRAAGVQVCIGGLHASGEVSMLDAPTPELREAEALGVSLFLGEAEGSRFDRVLRDAHAVLVEEDTRRAARSGRRPMFRGINMSGVR